MVKLQGIEDVEDFRNHVLRQRDQIKAGAAVPQLSETGEAQPNNESVELLREIRDTLNTLANRPPD